MDNYKDDFNYIKRNKFLLILFLVSIVVIVSIVMTIMNVLHFPDVLPIGRISGVLIFILVSSRYKLIDKVYLICFSKSSIVRLFIYYTFISLYVSIGYILGALLETFVLSLCSSITVWKVIELTGSMPSLVEIEKAFIYSLFILTFCDFMNNTIEKLRNFYVILFFLLTINIINGYKVLIYISRYFVCSSNNVLSYIWWIARMIVLVIFFLIINFFVIKKESSKLYMEGDKLNG